jgi:hypothetical protein
MLGKYREVFKVFDVFELEAHVSIKMQAMSSIQIQSTYFDTAGEVRCLNLKHI